MKNFVDFMFGSLLYWFIGFGLMFGAGGFIGMPHFFDLSFLDSDLPREGFLVFQTVFCATAATIVSGAMAERTKFSMYLVYTIFISVLIYPISGHWTWGGGWLMNGEEGSFMMNLFGTTFHDFAGSTIVHSVGGWIALVGAAILGPRIGKYGKDGKSRAIPGHNLTVAALGVFILWFGWFGFNPGSQLAASTEADAMAISHVFLTTNLAACAGGFFALAMSWMKYGKPSLSLTLNGVLAGLVGITAGCANVDAVGATIIGLVDGILVVIVVEFIDQKLKIDDPVGAVAVHGCNGLWGTVAVGLFDYNNGVFYGGGFHQLGVQVLGVVCIAAYTAVAMTIVFTILKHTIGLRVSAEEEIMGLDIAEHDLASAYADFLPISATTMGGVTTETIDVTDLRDKKLAPVIGGAKEAGGRYTKLTIMCKEDRFAILKDAMSQIGVTGMTVSHVMGCGTQKGKTGQYRGVKIDMNLLPQLQVDIVVSTVPPELVVEAAKKALYTGEYGDGKIFLYDVENVVRIRTNETGIAALDNEEK